MKNELIGNQLFIWNNFDKEKESPEIVRGINNAEILFYLVSGLVLELLMNATEPIII
jgi:hypothetical protein